MYTYLYVFIYTCMYIFHQLQDLDLVPNILIFVCVSNKYCIHGYEYTIYIYTHAHISGY